MLRELELDCPRERRRIVEFIRDYLGGAGYSRLVLGVSGGLDSALVAALCAEALGRENVRGLILPCHSSDPLSEKHALLQIEALGLPHERFDITPVVQPFAERYPDINTRRMGNLMARARMMTLFDQAAAWDALVAGTSNRTEYLLGYFTIYGDSAASLEPIEHLYKCQVRSLARHMGVLRDIIEKPPSADLWKGQTDEGELGFTYDEADAILYLYTERGERPEQIAARGYAPEVIQAVIRRMRGSEFKRQPPPVLSVEGRHDAGKRL